MTVRRWRVPTLVAAGYCCVGVLGLAAGDPTGRLALAAGLALGWCTTLLAAAYERRDRWLGWPGCLVTVPVIVAGIQMLLAGALGCVTLMADLIAAM